MKNKATKDRKLPNASLMPGLFENFAEAGVVVIEYALLAADVTAMHEFFPRLAPQTAGARASDFSLEAQRWYAEHDGLQTIASQLIGQPAHLSRLQAFDKSPSTNWFVPWHQDRAAEGEERAVAVLETMVALRIHLDDCDEDNGPLDVLPGSHRHGRLEADAIARLAAETPSRLCLAACGDIVALRPLLVHRSQRARKPAARRVVHIEFAARSEPAACDDKAYG